MTSEAINSIASAFFIVGTPMLSEVATVILVEVCRHGRIDLAGNDPQLGLPGRHEVNNLIIVRRCKHTGKSRTDEPRKSG